MAQVCQIPLESIILKLIWYFKAPEALAANPQEFERALKVNYFLNVQVYTEKLPFTT